MNFKIVCLILATVAVNAEIQFEDNKWLNKILPPSERTIEDQLFEPLHTYTFLYDAQLATGIPGASKQHSGTRIQCLAELLFISPTSCVLQLTHVRFGRLNRMLSNPRFPVPFEVFEEVQIHDDVRRTLQAPVGFTYQDGVVGDVTFDGEESPWTSNVIRGVLNMFQITLKSERQLPTEELKLVNVVKAKDEFVHSRAKQYRVQEKTLEGECDSIYTMYNNTPISANIDKFVTLKSIDFDNCRMRPQIKYNFRFADSCSECKNDKGKKRKDDFLKSSTLGKYEIRMARNGGGWMLERSTFESEHMFTPYDPQAGVVVSYINQTLTLIMTNASIATRRHLNHPALSDWGLTYALDFDIWKERFSMDGEEDRQSHFLRRMPYSDVKSQKRQLIGGLIRALLAHMKSTDGSLDEEAPSHLMKLVYAFRLFTKNELDNLYEELTSPDQGSWTVEQRKIIKDIIPHIVAMCSTKECLAHLVEKIKDGSVPPTKAATVIKCLLNDKSISEKEIALLLDLAENEVVAKNFFLRQSLWLTIGSLMNGLCMPNEDVLAREYRENTNTFCTRQLKENYVELLFNKFNTADKWADRILYMKTIGNAGLDLSVFNLEKIIRNIDGQSIADPIRSEAILALRQLNDVMPKKIQKILLPIVSNWRESPRVRMSAAYQLLQTLPERAILDQVARMLFFEPSKQVASFIYTYMNTMVQSSNPCERKFATDLKIALRHAHALENEFDWYYSSMKHLNFFKYNSLYRTGLDMDYGSVFTNSSFLPKYLTATLHAKAMGFWHKYLFTLGFVQDGLEPVVRDWMLGNGKSIPQLAEETNNRFRRFLNGMQNELNSLFVKLGIKTRANPDNTPDPKAYAYMKVMDQDYAMLPLILTHGRRDQKLGDGVIDLQKFKDDLRKGISININEASLLMEMTYKIPTILGMPLVWQTKLPLMYTLNGRIQLTSTPENGTWENMKIIFDVKPSFVATMITEMEVWSPVVNSGLQILSKAKLHTPIDARLEIDRRSDPAVSKFVFKIPPGKRELLSLENRPFTVTRVWPHRVLKTWNEPDTVSIISEDVSLIKQFKQCFGKQLFGFEVCARGQFVRTNELAKHAPRCPLIGPEKILITAESMDARNPTEITIKLTTKLHEKSTSPIRSSFTDWIEFSEPSNNTPDSDQSSETGSQNQADQRQYEVKKPWKNTIKLELKSKNRKLLQADFTHHYDPNHLYAKIDWKIQSPSVPQFSVCLKSETLFPKMPYTIDDMKNIDLKKAISSNKIVWGNQQCEGPNYILIQMQAQQPKSHYDVHRRDPNHIILENCLDKEITANCSPILQYDHILKASDLTKYRFMIEHKNVPPPLANMTAKAYGYLTHVLFSHGGDVDVTNIRNEKSTIHVDLELDTRDKTTGVLTVQTPNEKAQYTDVPIPSIIPILNLKYTRMKTFVDFFSGYGNRASCHVSKRKIKTFDKVEFKVPLSNCFHILAKDCSTSEPRFVVMMRKISDDEKKEIKIITSTHKVLMSLKDDKSIQIDINGQKYKANQDEVQEINGEKGRIFIKIYAIGPYVKLEFPETKFFVYFDGFAANIKISPIYKQDQCGLCGHFDNERSDEFRKPNYELEQDVRQFYKTWIINEPSGCTMPDVKTICPDKNCAYRPFADVTIPDSENPEKIQYSENPKKKTRVIEMGSQVCFSTEPVDECPLKTYPIEKVTKQIQFVCYQRDDEIGESMWRNRRLEDVIEVDGQATGVKKLDVPVKCAALTEF